MAWSLPRLNKKDMVWFNDFIESPIEDLIIKLNTLPFLRTWQSCGGHIGEEYLSHTGIIFYIDEDNKETEKFIKELKNLIKKEFKFARLIPLPGKIWNHPLYKIEVDWLIYPKKREKKKLTFYLETYGKLHFSVEQLANKYLEE